MLVFPIKKRIGRSNRYIMNIIINWLNLTMSFEGINALDSTSRSNSDNVVLELVSEHYGGLVNPDEIPSWTSDAIFAPCFKTYPLHSFVCH